MCVYVCYIFCIGGRGRAGAGRRGKDGGIVIYILEEGAVREPVGGGKTVLLLYIHTNTYI